ncbi:MAG: alpha-galactosidase, partial [Daejeonella sp.]|nr:alpha-galactosidase [Daejeonella sp.]
MKLKILFFLTFTLTISVKVYALDIPYGKSGKIVYNLPSGTFNIFENSVLILKNGFSTIKNHDKLISSKDYNQNTYSKINFKDGFGTGVKFTIFLKAKGLPDLKQVFYTYSNRSHFMCELELSGQALSSNQIMPIQGEIVIANKVEKEELRSLYVPFDNDTFISYNTPILKADTIIYSAEVSALYNNTSRKGIISGSLEHGNWKTGIKTSEDNHGVISLDVINGYTEKSLTRDDIPHGNISGTIIKSSKIFFGFFKDWRTGMDEYAKANRLVEPPIVFKWNQPTPIGWNSWGVMQNKISFKKASQVVDFFADSLKAFRNEGIAYIDLDSYWDKMIKGGLEGDYSELKAFADYTKKKGLKPGVYWAPFTDWGFKGGANRKAEGSSYTYGEMWTKIGSGFHDFDGARALDPTHPGTQKRIALVIGKLKDCGFEMIKIDFLGHAAVESDHFYNPKITTGMQAYKLGMEYLIKQLDSKMLVYAAISPSLASGRYIHSRRIACDAFKSIKDTEYTLNSVSNGWWQTYLYDYLDADHVVLATETEGANRARMISA